MVTTKRIAMPLPVDDEDEPLPHPNYANLSAAQQEDYMRTIAAYVEEFLCPVGYAWFMCIYKKGPDTKTVDICAPSKDLDKNKLARTLRTIANNLENDDYGDQRPITDRMPPSRN